MCFTVFTQKLICLVVDKFLELQSRQKKSVLAGLKEKQTGYIDATHLRRHVDLR